MKTIINNLFLAIGRSPRYAMPKASCAIAKYTLGLIMVSIMLVACDSNESSKSEIPKVEEGIDINKNPLEAIQKVIEIGTNVEDIQQEIANKEPVEPISLQELLEYLPEAPQGWTAEKPKGKTNSFGNHSISQVHQSYFQDDKQIKIGIFDWAFNSALYMPFLLTTEFSQESTDGYNKGIKIGDIPGREEYTYASKEGSLNLLVNSRFLVEIEGFNIENTELREWWQRFDTQSLAKISNK